MLAEALRAEVAAYCAQFADERDENGCRLVVRNGYHEPREVTTAAGAVQVHAPRVNDGRVDPDTGKRQRFSSAILPPWARKTPQVQEVLPLLYPARALVAELRAGAGAVPRLDQGPVGGDDRQADRDLAGRAEGVRAAGPVECGLRVRLGRRHRAPRSVA
jgi:Transposase, Mutator family